jgi:UDP-N-acetylglucosamine diphosphorylase/glucosamine-1-phosphate N-acetyltransferase
MNIVFFDDANRDNLLPLTYTRPCAKLRLGILTIEEKWLKYWGGQNVVSYITADYLSTKFPLIQEEDNLYLNGSVCPSADLVAQIKSLEMGEALIKDELIVACRASSFPEDLELDIEVLEVSEDLVYMEGPYSLFSHNAEELERDFDLVTAGRESIVLSNTNTIIGDRFFAEVGAKAECAVFNTKSGAIYLAADSEVMEGSVIRGALALGEHSTLKLSTKIYGATTIGPHCKVGGEVNNCVILGFSNKGHDGFLGNSVVGEWCNIGADTNNSNLKNNYEEVKLWNYAKNGFRKTGLQFCGLIFGDHSKCGINTMFNTGTVVGVSANIYGSGFPRNFIPSYSWGGYAGFTEYKFEKAMKTAELVMSRRNVTLDQVERDILQAIFDKTAHYR